MTPATSSSSHTGVRMNRETNKTTVTDDHHIRSRSLIAALILAACVGPARDASAADPSCLLKTSFKSIEKGGKALFTVECNSDLPVAGFVIAPQPPPGFKADAVGDVPRQLPGGRSVFQYVVTAELSMDPRIRLLSTAYEPSFGFDISYVKDGQTRNMHVEQALTYTTAKAVYYGYAILGVLIGFFIKSLIAWQALPADPSKPSFTAFLTARTSNVVVVLVLGMMLLISMQVASPVLPAHNFGEALLIGFGLGIIGDETLLQKLQGKK